jgi:uncharacterized protein YutE (UPF0331/DUF86 family)
MIDTEKLKSRVLTIRENVAKIEQYAKLTDEEFWADERNLYSIKYLMLESIEAAASLCSHLVAHYGGQSPSSFPECFETLGRLGIVSDELSGKLIAMARFRNLLVHRYWEVDNQRVLEIARKDIYDLFAFLSAVGEATSDKI